jgi:hypothetical protein
MEDFGKRTTVSLFAAFLIFAAGFVAMVDRLGPSAHSGRHLHFVAASKS